MEKILVNDILQEASRWGFSLDEQKAKLFVKYYEILLQENQKYNLTRITMPESVLEELFFDSLAGFLKAKNKTVEDLVDLGSGAGFPGIPLKIYFPVLKLTVVDASQKKISFLRFLINKLDLNGINLMHKRAEDLGRGPGRETYSHVTARALAPLPVAVELALPLLKKGGLFWAFKGPSALSELNRAKEIVRRCGGKHIDTITYSLPRSKKKRIVLIFSKENETEKIFPRRAGIPQKRPLEKIIYRMQE